MSGFKDIDSNFEFRKNIKFLDRETQLIRTIVKGLDVSVYGVQGKEVNSFVIPGYYAGLEIEKKKMAEEMIQQFARNNVRKNFWDVLLSTQVESVYAMRNYSINSSAHTVTFRGSNLSKISIFVTSATLVYLTPEQRCGIYLHEIGHWVDVAKRMPYEMIKNVDHERMYFLQQQISKYYTTRYNEFAADRFVKEIGYGEYLVSALNYQDTIDTGSLSLAARFYNYTVKKAVNEHDRLEDAGVADITAHPSRKTRVKYLRDEYSGS